MEEEKNPQNLVKSRVSKKRNNVDNVDKKYKIVKSLGIQAEKMCRKMWITPIKIPHTKSEFCTICMWIMWIIIFLKDVHLFLQRFQRPLLSTSLRLYNFLIKIFQSLQMMENSKLVYLYF